MCDPLMLPRSRGREKCRGTLMRNVLRTAFGTVILLVTASTGCSGWGRDRCEAVSHPSRRLNHCAESLTSGSDRGDQPDPCHPVVIGGSGPRRPGSPGPDAGRGLTDRRRLRLGDVRPAPVPGVGRRTRILRAGLRHQSHGDRKLARGGPASAVPRRHNGSSLPAEGQTDT